MDTRAVAGLKRLSRRKHNHLRYPKVPYVFRDTSTHQERERSKIDLWKQWGMLAHAHKRMLASKRVPWAEGDKNLCEMNRLLLLYLCPSLARTARVASIPIGNSLRTAGILVYAVIGRFAPYVG